MRHSQQNCQALIAGMLLDFRGKHPDCVRKLGSLKQCQAKIHLQTRQFRIKGYRLPVVIDRLLQLLLPRLKQAKVRERLNVVRFSLRNRLPCLLCPSVIATLFERECIGTRAGGVNALCA